MPARASLVAALGLSGSSAVLYVLAYPPYGVRTLAFVCLVPLFLALRSGGFGRAVALAWLWAMLAAWGITGALPASIADYYERPTWFGVLAASGVFTFTAALYYMAFAAVERGLSRRSEALGPFLVAAAWVAVEFARARLWTGSSLLVGNPFGLIGYTHAWGSLAQLASWTGVYGISFVIVAVNAALATWIAQRDARAARFVAVSVGLAAFAALGGGHALRAAPDADRRDGDFRRVGIAQGNVALGRRWRSDFYAENLDVYLDLTRRAIENGAPPSVVWPEAAMTFFVETEPTLAAAIAEVLGPADVEVLAGGPGRAPTADERVRVPGARDAALAFNSLFRIGADGALHGRYDKEVLVPFFESFPLPRLDLVRRSFGGTGRFASGAEAAAPLETRLGRVGVLICFEAMLGEVAAARVRAGAEVLVSPSNDSWIEDTGIAEHLFAMSRLRAIEQRRYLVRASTSGPSGIVDPWGRVAVRTTPFQREVLVGRVEPMQERSGYGMLGDLFAYCCTGWVVASALRTRRSTAIATQHEGTSR